MVERATNIKNLSCVFRMRKFFHSHPASENKNKKPKRKEITVPTQIKVGRVNIMQYLPRRIVEKEKQEAYDDKAGFAPVF